MNRILKPQILLFLLISSSFYLHSLSIEGTGTIDMVVYNSSNYERTEIFLEQDLIYGRTVQYEQGLELICFQDKVKVEISGYDTLYSPVDLDNIPAGDYTVKLIKTGYYPSEFRISISSNERTSVTVNMVRYTTLLIIESIPENSVIYINNQKVLKNTIEVPRGDNSIRISAFGYKDYSDIINIDNNEDYTLRPELIKRDFALNELEVSRETIWLNDSRSQKKSNIYIYADAPGNGILSIHRISDGKLIESHKMEFLSAKIEYIFNIENLAESATEDQYRISVEGSDNVNSDKTEKIITVKNGIKSIWRNNISGFSGLLFAPSAETLPGGGAQLQTAAGTIFNTNSMDDLYFPALMSLRVGILENLELSLGTGLNISNLADETSINLFISGKYSFFTTDGSDGFTLSTGLSVNYNGKISSFELIPSDDPFTRFSGISLVFPLQYRKGPFLFVLTPELKFSPSFPGIIDGGFIENQMYIWNYFRAAIAMDIGQFSTAISVALQSPSYINSNSQWPLFAGIEFNSTPGNSGFSFSVFGGIKYISGESIRISSGLSAGFIF